MKEEIFELFDEYDTDTLIVTDFDIKFHGARVDVLFLNKKAIQIWGGNPFEDEYAEQFIPNEEERNAIYEEVLKYM